MVTKYKCPECKKDNWNHIGEGELECFSCGCIAGAEHFEVKKEVSNN